MWLVCCLPSLLSGMRDISQAALKLNKGWPWTHSLGPSSLELTVTFLFARMTWSWALTCKFIFHPDAFHSHSPITSFSASTESRRQELWAEDQRSGSLPSPSNWDQGYGPCQCTQSVSESCSLIPSLTRVFQLENYIVWIIPSCVFTGKDSFVLIMAHFRSWRKRIGCPRRKESSEGNTKNLSIVLRLAEILQ